MSGNSHPANLKPPRVRLFGCEIDNLSPEEAIQRVAGFIEGGGTHQYFAVNVHKVVAFRHFPELKAIANRSDLVTADGQPVVWASRWLKKNLRERVTGVDLMTRLMKLATARQYRVYFLGARPVALANAVDYCKQHFPGLVIVGTHDGYWSPQEESAVVNSIREARPHVLFVGMSSPKKELFIDRYLEDLQVPFVMGVGGGFDVLAGVVRRAPQWMQRAGLEWLWRVSQEPGRLWGRYMLDGVQFSFILIRELVTRRILKRADVSTS